MTNKQVEMYLCQGEMPVVEAMQKIDDNAKGVLFVTEEEGQLVGSLTDGDIRRWLIKTNNLTATVSEIMNTSPRYIFEGEREKASAYMRGLRIKVLPVLDVHNRIVEIIFDTDAQSNTIKRQANSLKEIPVIIMAGGKGTRLYPYTKILPKPLIPIGDVPILERIINRFFQYGIEDYYLTINYKKGMIKSYFSELQPQYKIFYIEEEKPLGTAGSIRLIQKKFKMPIIVTNCDILIDADYENIVKYHKESGNDLTVISALKNMIVPYGVLHVKEQGIIASVEEKPKMTYLINTGMYVLSPEVIEENPNNTFFHMTDLLNVLMKKGKKVGMYPVSEDSFLDMGELEEMRKMEKRINQSREE